MSPNSARNASSPGASVIKIKTALAPPIILHRKQGSVSLFASTAGDLESSRFFKGRVRSIFSNGLKTFGRDHDMDALAELRDEDLSFLEVCLAADRARWVELGCARAVRVPSADER